MKKSTRDTVIAVVVVVVVIIIFYNYNQFTSQQSNSGNNNIITTTSNQQKSSFSGSMSYVTSYESTSPNGQAANVFEIRLEYTPSILSELQFNVQTQQGYSAFLQTTSYESSAAWPSNQPEIDYVANPSYSTSTAITAFSPFASGSSGTEVESGTILYLVGFNGVTFTGAQITLTSLDYTGSVSYTIP